MSKTYLVFDISNLLYRSFYANRDEKEDITAGLAHHYALMTLNKYYKQFKADKIIMAFDAGESWRKEYTLDSELCLSGKIYKGNRRKSMTPSEKLKYERYLEHVKEFEVMMREHTSVICLSGSKLEADDFIAGFIQMHPDDQIVVVSSDKDFVQLLRENVKLIEPDNGTDRRIKLNEEWYGDVDYFMFEKCLRGDAGDNVQSAFPRVRSTKIRQAYEDPFTRANMMQETWTDQNERLHVVGDLFEENQLLMNLERQPECVRLRLFKIIIHEIKNPGKYSHFHFLRFCGKYELNRIIESIDNFIPLLSK